MVQEDPKYAHNHKYLIVLFGKERNVLYQLLTSNTVEYCDIQWYKWQNAAKQLKQLVMVMALFDYKNNSALATVQLGIWCFAMHTGVLTLAVMIQRDTNQCKKDTKL